MPLHEEPKPENDLIQAAVEGYIAAAISPAQGPFTPLLTRDLRAYTSAARANPGFLHTLRDPFNNMVSEILASLPKDPDPANTQSETTNNNFQPSPNESTESTESLTPIRQTTKNRVLVAIKKGLNRFGFPVFVGLAGLTGTAAAYLEHKNIKDEIEVLPHPIPDSIPNHSEFDSTKQPEDEFIKNLPILKAALLEMIAACVESLPDNYPIKKHLQVFGDQEAENFLKSLHYHYSRKNIVDPEVRQVLEKMLINALPRIAVAKMAKAAGLAYGNVYIPGFDRYADGNLIILNANIDSMEYLLSVLMHEFLHSEIQRSAFPESRVLREGVTELKARQITNIPSNAYEKLTYRAFLLELMDAKNLNLLYSGSTADKNSGAELQQSFYNFIGLNDLKTWQSFLEGEDDLGEVIFNAKHTLEQRLRSLPPSFLSCTEENRMSFITAILATHKGLDVHKTLELMLEENPPLFTEENTSKAFMDARAEVKDQYAKTGRVEILPDYFKQYLEPLSKEEIAAMEAMNQEANNLAHNIIPDIDDHSLLGSPAFKKSVEILLALLLAFFTLKKIGRREKLSTELIDEESLFQIASISKNRRFNQALFLSQLSPRRQQKNSSMFEEDLQIITTLESQLEYKISNALLSKGLAYTVFTGIALYLIYFDLYNLTGVILNTTALQSLRWLYAKEYGHLAQLGEFTLATGELRELGRNIPESRPTETIHAAATSNPSDPQPLVFKIFESAPKNKNLKAIRYREETPGIFMVTSIDTTTGVTSITMITLDEEAQAKVKLEESACRDKPDRFDNLKIDVELKEDEKIDGYFEFSNNLYLMEIKQKGRYGPRFRVLPGPFYEGKIAPKFFHIDRYDLTKFDIMKFEFVFVDKTTGETTRIHEKKPREDNPDTPSFTLSADKNGEPIAAAELGHLIMELDLNNPLIQDRIKYVSMNMHEVEEIKRRTAKGIFNNADEMEFKIDNNGFSYMPRSSMLTRAAPPIFIPKLDETITVSPDSTTDTTYVLTKNCKLKKAYKIGQIYIFNFTENYSLVTFDDGTSNLSYDQNLALHIGQAPDGTPFIKDPSPTSLLVKHGINELFRPVAAGRGEYPETPDTDTRATKVIEGLCKSFGLQFSGVAEETKAEKPLTKQEKISILTGLAAKLPGQLLIEEASENLRKKTPFIPPDPFGRSKKAAHLEPKQSDAHGPEIVNGKDIKAPDAGDFDGHDNYNAGDDLRHLDWRTSSRTSHLVVKRYRHSRETEFAKRNIIVATDSLLDEATYRELFNTLFETLHDKNYKKFKSIVMVAADTGHYEIIDLEKLTINNLSQLFDTVISRSKEILENNTGTGMETNSIKISRIKRHRKKHGRQKLSDEKLEQMVGMRTRLAITKTTLDNLKIPKQLKAQAVGIGFESPSLITAELPKT